MRRRRLKNAHPDPAVQLRGGRIPMASLVQTLAVAEYLSFHRAAKALGTSQASVSTRIKALEEDLGVLLFDRNTRGVRLTEAGRRFVDQVDSAMDILDHAIKTAGMRAGGEEGELRIGVHALLPGCFLDRLLKHFYGEYPNIRLHVAEGTARESQIMVREGNLDVAFMACTHEIPDLNSRVIWHDRLMIAVATTHPFAASENVEWRDLAGETFLVRQCGTGPQVNDLIVVRSAGKWPVPTILRHDVGHEALLAMIAAGHGISILVEENAVAATTHVRFLPIRDEPETVAFSAVWPPHIQNPALANLLALAADMGRSRPTA